MIVVDLSADNGADAFASYQPMATAIVAVIREKGRCLPQDLFDRGFSTKETLERWRLANAMAELELQLLDETEVLS
jgi:hypothetical protein